MYKVRFYKSRNEDSSIENEDSSIGNEDISIEKYENCWFACKGMVGRGLYALMMHHYYNTFGPHQVKLVCTVHILSFKHDQFSITNDEFHFK